MAKEFRVSHGAIRLDGLGQHGTLDYFHSALEQSWVAGTRVTRYARTWRLSKQTEFGDGILAGHLGYVNEGEISTINWDEDKKDFIRGEVTSGIIVPFLINSNLRIITFQLFSNKVRQRTVTSNLQALLNVHKTHIWKISPFLLKREFSQWLTSVDSVSNFNARLEYPNPDWTGRENLENLIDGLEAETLSIQAIASEDGSIDTDSSWVEQAMDHVSQGYGRITMTGQDTRTKLKSQFVKSKAGESIPLITPITKDSSALEASFEDLHDAQNDLTTTYYDQLSTETDEGTNEGLEDETD